MGDIVDNECLLKVRWVPSPTERLADVVCFPCICIGCWMGGQKPLAALTVVDIAMRITYASPRFLGSFTFKVDGSRIEEL